MLVAEMAFKRDRNSPSASCVPIIISADPSPADGRVNINHEFEFPPSPKLRTLCVAMPPNRHDGKCAMFQPVCYVTAFERNPSPPLSRKVTEVEMEVMPSQERMIFVRFPFGL